MTTPRRPTTFDLPLPAAPHRRRAAVLVASAAAFTVLLTAALLGVVRP